MASGRQPKRCEGTRKGHDCGGATFRCSNPECGSLGCEKKGCTERQFMPIQKCKDCGHAYERIQQFEVAPVIVDDGAGSSAPGVRMRLPSTEILFGAVLGLVALMAAAAMLGGGLNLAPQGAGASPAPQVSMPEASLSSAAYTDVCQCYKEGMALAGTGMSVLSSKYRTGFVQCRAIFGPEGGDAWTAGWTAREQGKMVGAGCRSWRRGFGR